MTGECQHCWHSTNQKGENKPTCCWCGTSITFTFATDADPAKTHGHHVARKTLTPAAIEAMTTLERIRGALQGHGLGDAEDDVLGVMDQIAGWCSPDMRL